MAEKVQDKKSQKHPHGKGGHGPEGHGTGGGHGGHGGHSEGHGSQKPYDKGQRPEQDRKGGDHKKR